MSSEKLDQETQIAPDVATKLRSRQVWRRWGLILSGVGVAGLALACGIRESLKWVPADVAVKAPLSPEQQREALESLHDRLDAALERSASRDASIRHPWSLQLTEEQLQAWLEEHLPNEPSFAVPGEVTRPRLILREESATFACDFRSPRIASVISLELEPYPVERSNSLGIRVRRARAGWIPVPLTKVMWRMMLIAHEAGLRVSCEQQAESANALLTLPELQQGQQIRIHECKLTPGGLVLRGESQTVVETPSQLR